MKQKISISILTFFCIWLLSFSAFASSNRVALVIGNSAYKSAPLVNPANDAKDMAIVLKRLGFDVIKRIDADKRQMKTAINKFYKGLRKSEIGLFYFAGHGMQINNANYLIPVNANIESESDVEFESIHAGRILGKMRDADNQLNIVILDACRDNPFKRSFRTGSKGLAQMDAPKGSIIVYATSPSSLAEDGKGRNGTYTGNLLENIERSDLTVQQVFNETGRGVMAETNDRQIPWMSSTPVAEFYLAGGSVIVTKPKAADTGSLKVKSTPQGAQIYLNGKSRGTAPKTFSNLSPGTYKVKAALFGYNAEEKRIRVNSGRAAILTFYLDPAASVGRLYVNTDPSGATVKVLNISPKFYQGMKLDAGTYRIKVQKKGYISKTELVNIVAGKAVDLYMELEKEKIKLSGKNFTNSLGMEFVYIEPGTFMMGSPSNESNRDSDENQHKVTLTKGFYMQTTEVTQEQWKLVMGTQPWSGKDFVRDADNNPAVYVSWNDAQEFIKKLNSKEGGGKYRLPTEAEWEYTCRAGSTTRFCFGNSDSQLGDYAWYEKNAWDAGDKYAHRVGVKKPNAWGLYDMHGNVWEWCQDWYGNYSSGSVTDPKGPSSVSYRVLRGGGWYIIARGCRSANRFSESPGGRGRSRGLGFRLSRTF